MSGIFMFKRLAAYWETPTELKPRLPFPYVDLYNWAPGDGRVNFGDHLSEIVTRQLLALQGLSLDQEVSKSARLLAIGSILQYSANDDHIWGTGWNGKVPEIMFKSKRLNLHAVRGPLTREFLRSRGFTVPKVYGDPALLMPHLFKGRFTPNPCRDYVFVPNLHDLSILPPKTPNVISPLQGWNRVIEQILEAKLVLASSLHGLVIAEAYGIPARYVRLSQTEDLFKYKDYYFGSGRLESEFQFANSIAEGQEMGGMPGLRFDHQSLLDAFPLHLWN
jgi:pyruvyltransferase